MRENRVSIKLGDLLCCTFEETRYETHMMTAWSIDKRHINIPCCYLTISEEIEETDNGIHIFDVNDLLFQRVERNTKLKNKVSKINYGNIRMMDRRYVWDDEYWTNEYPSIIPNAKMTKHHIERMVYYLDTDELYRYYNSTFYFFRGQNVE